jgi:hypothetical protein
MKKSALFTRPWKSPRVESTHRRGLTVMRLLGALALLVIGGLHYQQYRYAFYSSIPTIGPLFIVNFVSATALGLLLLTPIRSRLVRRGRLLHQLAAVGGIGVAGGGLVALLISERTPLFGFMEHGYRFAIVLAIVSDAVAIMTLALFLLCARTGRHVSPTVRSPKNPRPVAPATER